MNLFLIMRFFLRNAEPGHIIEFGSYKGGNAIFMAYLASQLHPAVRVYALDSFVGMPAVDKGVDAHNEADFHDVDLEEVREYVEQIGLNNIEFVKGLFEETAGSVLEKAHRIALAHIDCDILSSVKFAYETVKPYMCHGGYLVFDDANTSSCIGATEAVEDFVIRRDGMNSEQIYPHFVFRRLDN
jgi:predicted O-methyltransferase YrrM